MDTLLDTAARIVEIEARQDDALRQLADLERRVERVLAEYLPMPAQVASAAERSRTAMPDAAPPAIKAA